MFCKEITFLLDFLLVHIDFVIKENIIFDTCKLVAAILLETLMLF